MISHDVNIVGESILHHCEGESCVAAQAVTAVLFHDKSVTDHNRTHQSLADKPSPYHAGSCFISILTFIQ